LADDSACILSMTGVRVEPDCFPLWIPPRCHCSDYPTMEEKITVNRSWAWVSGWFQVVLKYQVKDGLSAAIPGALAAESFAAESILLYRISFFRLWGLRFCILQTVNYKVCKSQDSSVDTACLFSNHFTYYFIPRHIWSSKEKWANMALLLKSTVFCIKVWFDWNVDLPLNIQGFWPHSLGEGQAGLSNSDIKVKVFFSKYQVHVSTGPAMAQIMQITLDQNKPITYASHTSFITYGLNKKSSPG
jgi:hypothetical protein